MVRLTRIYTRGGDAGETHLGDMSRVPKTHARVEAFGDVDETNSVIGVVRANGIDPGTDDWLRIIQNDLFDLGADLCVPEPQEETESPALRVSEGQVAQLEQWIDGFVDRLRPLESFILPGGSRAAAVIHHARTVCRRSEVEVLRLAEFEDLNHFALKYLNRLSDLLFVMARICNDSGVADILWIPGQNRPE